MKMLKKNPRKQLEKFSTVFTQLGLVLVLFVVYVTLEYESERTNTILEPVGEEIGEVWDLTEKPKVFVKEVEQVKQEAPKQRKSPDFNDPKIIDNDDEVKEVIDVAITDEDPVLDIDKLPEVDEGDDIELIDDPNTYTIRNLQNAPVFRGCEGLNEVEGRKCLERKIKKHVQRYFDADLAQDLGMRAGKYRISTQFIIDKDGQVKGLQIRVPHKKLEKEVKKVVTKLPKFTPGKQNNRPVKVKYTLPITFRVN
ncbi:energy transducer TonB [Tenacibaculum sp. 190524A02b]|uniref:energy transducer TonB n=1 Tax=Tenacibaculum vairaonense TaxID=3137860 RepID=UPI0031FB4D3F